MHEFDQHGLLHGLVVVVADRGVNKESVALVELMDAVPTVYMAKHVQKRSSLERSSAQHSRAWMRSGVPSVANTEWWLVGDQHVETVRYSGELTTKGLGILVVGRLKRPWSA